MVCFLNNKIETVDKEDILRVLMQKDPFFDSPKKKKKVEITYGDHRNKATLEKTKSHLNLSYANKETNPEFTTDFRTAIVKILAKMSQEPDNPDNQILKVLISDNKKLEAEVGKVSDFVIKTAKLHQ